MKHNALLRILAAIGTVLLLLQMTSAVFAEEPGCDTIWDITAEQVLLLSSAFESKEPTVTLFNEYTDYEFHPAAEGMEANFINYIFRQDALVMYIKLYSKLFQPEDVEMQDIYDAELAELTEKYGEPTLMDAESCRLAYNAVESGYMIAESVSQFKGWELEDGATCNLLIYDDVYDINVMTIFINAPLIDIKGE